MDEWMSDWVSEWVFICIVSRISLGVMLLLTGDSLLMEKSWRLTFLRLWVSGLWGTLEAVVHRFSHLVGVGQPRGKRRSGSQQFMQPLTHPFIYSSRSGARYCRFSCPEGWAHEKGEVGRGLTFYSPIHPSTHPSIHLPIHSCIYSCIHASIYPGLGPDCSGSLNASLGL